MDYEAVIIGAGVVGLACAAILSESGRKCLVVERNASFGRETSSRNSEVIHAGIYYPTDSLKAKLSVPGKYKIYEWCKNHDVEYKKIGKYIIATNESEIPELDKLLRQAKENGVEKIAYADPETFAEQEPHINCVAALFSEDTGIVDSHALMKSFADHAAEYGCDFAYKHNLQTIERIGGNYELGIFDPANEICHISAAVVINAAGLDSDIVAERAGIDIDKFDYRLTYSKGHYFRLSPSKKHFASHLIYPVPHQNVSCLGIHITKDMNDEIKLGPDIHYQNDRSKDYSVPEQLHQKFYEAAKRYLPELQPEDITADQSGIRPKLQKEGGRFRDFVISEESSKGLPGFVNLIGIESPGLTSSLEIAHYVQQLLNQS